MTEPAGTEPARGAAALDYPSFWLVYLRAHERPANRHLHFAGSLLVLLVLAIGLWRGDWRYFAVLPLIGYGFAWAGHFLIEHNRPATFGHPFWSLYSDYRMLFLWLGGSLRPHLARAGALAGGPGTT